MKNYKEEAAASLIQMTLSDFLNSYNKNMPERFPRATTALLLQFKTEHTAFFKHGDLWSLDEHRKKIMDWIPFSGVSS